MGPPGDAVTADAVIYLPGIMGSELVDAKGRVVWGMSPRLLARQVFFRDVLDRLHPAPNDGISASRPVQLPISVPLLSGVEPYNKLASRLAQVVLDPLAVRHFAYDWRHSVAAAAAELAPVARAHLKAWRARFAALPDDVRRGRPEPRLVLVGHSMGGLVASWFATKLKDQGGADVRLVVTLGTPFEGSLNAVRVLSTGKYLPLGMFAESLRNAARNMPGLYELLPTFPCVAQSANPDGTLRTGRRLTSGDVETVGGNPELAEDALTTMATLRDAVAGAPAGHIRPLVGTTQPTHQTVRLAGDPVFEEWLVDQDGVQEDHRGDGTVYRYAASLPGAPAYVPQGHGALAKSNEGVEYAAAVVTERPLGPFQAASEIGLRVPELVVIGTPITVEAVDAEAGTVCQVHDAETNELVAVAPFTARDGGLAVDITPSAPGLYRVSAAAGGFSPVERLVLVADPD